MGSRNFASVWLMLPGMGELHAEGNISDECFDEEFTGGQ